MYSVHLWTYVQLYSVQRTLKLYSRTTLYCNSLNVHVMCQRTVDLLSFVCVARVRAIVMYFKHSFTLRAHARECIRYTKMINKS